MEIFTGSFTVPGPGRGSTVHLQKGRDGTEPGRTWEMEYCCTMQTAYRKPCTSHVYERNPYACVYPLLSSPGCYQKVWTDIVFLKCTRHSACSHLPSQDSSSWIIGMGRKMPAFHSQRIKTVPCPVYKRYMIFQNSKMICIKAPLRKKNVKTFFKNLIPAQSYWNL